MFKRFDIFDITMCVILTPMILFMGFLIFVAFPKSYEANKLCHENGYTDSEWYFDGSIYCSRKGELGKDEVVRIK